MHLWIMSLHTTIIRNIKKRTIFIIVMIIIHNENSLFLVMTGIGLANFFSQNNCLSNMLYEEMNIFALWNKTHFDLIWDRIKYKVCIMTQVSFGLHTKQIPHKLIKFKKEVEDTRRQWIHAYHVYYLLKTTLQSIEKDTEALKTHRQW